MPHQKPPCYYYAVAIGRMPGIYGDWPTAQKQTDHYAGNKHKRLKTLNDAKAYMTEHCISSPKLFIAKLDSQNRELSSNQSHSKTETDEEILFHLHQSSTPIADGKLN